MLLRRITEHVKNQNWFAVMLDFIIVVFGVFIGLQVANWNEARSDRQRANIYLERISADLEADIYNYLDSIRFWRQISRYGRDSLAFAETKNLSGQTNWELLLAYYQASQVDEFATTQTTYDELTSAGELRLITNDAIRQKIASYYSTANNTTLALFPAYREHVRGIVPIKIQDYIWDNCYASNENDQEVFACDAPVSEEVAAQLIDRLSENGPLMEELRYWVINMRVATTISQSRIELANTMQRMIREELGITQEEVAP